MLEQTMLSHPTDSEKEKKDTYEGARRSRSRTDRLWPLKDQEPDVEAPFASELAARNGKVFHVLFFVVLFPL